MGNISHSDLILPAAYSSVVRLLLGTVSSCVQVQTQTESGVQP